jgi:uncharacterized protein (TIGR00730 family)
VLLFGCHRGCRDATLAPVPIELRRVCVFCGSSSGDDGAYVATAAALAAELVAQGIGVVYGGGSVGLMGVLADTALAAGGEVTGVIPRFLHRREIMHEGVTDLRVVESMHERKALMAELSDGFIVAPGGIGTLEEAFEALTWTQLGIHDKPVGLLDVGDFWDPVRVLLDRMVADGFLRPDVADLPHDSDPTVLLDALRAWSRPGLGKWIDLDPVDEPSTEAI